MHGQQNIKIYEKNKHFQRFPLWVISETVIDLSAEVRENHFTKMPLSQ